MKNNEDIPICKHCKGSCCKSSAGAVFPDQLKEITIGSLTKLVSDGYCFDLWEGNPTKDPKYNGQTAYFLRPKHTNALNRIVDASWGGTCSFLTDKGCKLKFDERPAMCQALEPMYGNCTVPKEFDKQHAAIAWLPFNEIIEKVIDTF